MFYWNKKVLLPCNFLKCKLWVKPLFHTHTLSQIIHCSLTLNFFRVQLVWIDTFHPWRDVTISVPSSLLNVFSLIGLNWSCGTIMFVHGETPIVHSVYLAKRPRWIVFVREKSLPFILLIHCFILYDVHSSFWIQDFTLKVELVSWRFKILVHWLWCRRKFSGKQ